MRFPKQRDVIVLDAEPHSGKEYWATVPKKKIFDVIWSL